MGVLDIDLFFSLKSIAFFIFTVVILWWKQNKGRGLPPGPTGLPFFGYLFFMGRHPPQTLMELSEKYGPMFTLKIAGKHYVVLSSYDVLNEALVKKGSVFSGREKQELSGEVASAHEGIVYGDYGPKWKSGRKFGMSTLKGFGVGKKSMEDRVSEEVRYLSEVILSNQGNPVDIHDDLSNAVANIICSILMGQRYEYKDESFRRLLSSLNNRFSNKAVVDKVVLMKFLPFLRYLPGYNSAFKVFMNQIIVNKETFNTIIEEHEATLDETDTRDFIDAYLKEIRTDEDGHFTRRRLDVFIRDLFNAGTETITTTLRWSLLYLAKHPRFQERLADEINAAAGNNGVISASRKTEMQLTCSFIQEIQRHRCIVPMVIHKVTEDVLFQGYVFPKDTCVMANIWAVHYDPDTFENPEEFRPDRFIDEKGMFFKHDHVIPYSIGPRYCLGVHLAEMEVFVFLTGILRNFKIQEDSAHPLPPFDSGASGLIYSPLPYRISFVPR